MIFALVTTSQLLVVIVGIFTAHLIWNNPPDCPEKYMKLEQTEDHEEFRKMCELKKYSYNKWRWVLKEYRFVLEVK